MHKKYKDIKKQFSHLLVLFFQFQIQLSNRRSVLIKNDKQKSSISDKLTAGTLRSALADSEPSFEVCKMDETLKNLEDVIAKLNEISDDFFKHSNDPGARNTKATITNLNDDNANFTNVFESANLMNKSMEKSPRMAILFFGLAFIVVVGFVAIFIYGHINKSVN